MLEQKAAGMDFGGTDARGLASSISAMTGVIGITLFYGTSYDEPYLATLGLGSIG